MSAFFRQSIKFLSSQIIKTVQLQKFVYSLDVDHNNVCKLEIDAILHQQADIQCFTLALA